MRAATKPRQCSVLPLNRYSSKGLRRVSSYNVLVRMLIVVTWPTDAELVYRQGLLIATDILCEPVTTALHHSSL